VRLRLRLAAATLVLTVAPASASYAVINTPPPTDRTCAATYADAQLMLSRGEVTQKRAVELASSGARAEHRMALAQARRELLAGWRAVTQHAGCFSPAQVADARANAAAAARAA